MPSNLNLITGQFDADRHTNTVGSQSRLSALVAEFIEADAFDTDPTWVLRWTLNQFARNDYDTFDLSHRQQALADPPPLVGHPGWDAFFAALADYLAERDNIDTPKWVDEPERTNIDGPMFFPGAEHRPRDGMQQWLSYDPAP